ncbi:hypothetical protein HPB48_022243 [Haemaphysalis longicornis]|uniref:Methyltransferase type 11 domain-containing protein n=1 Tax=Haemaphysalis longicornis TaxID=44386 RepID=A0A9J6GU70_HAELO|nr:hypothetical protein HPB48_022243 [Haemaphysalis longicornis]
MAKSPRHRALEHAFLATVLILGAVFCVPLSLCTRLRQWLFVRLLGVLTLLWPDDFEETKRATMAKLNEVESHDPELRAEGAIRVLEIGAGFGANFRFMQRKVKYWNVDPNTEFEGAFLETLKNYPKVEMERWVPSYGEDMKQVPDNHFDVVLITRLLCSVNNAERVLQECRRVLVKGGLLIFIEHVAQPKGSLGLFLQNVFTPVWRLVFCGCCLNRDSGELIKRAGFSEVHLRESFIDIAIILSRHVHGYAVA